MPSPRTPSPSRGITIEFFLLRLVELGCQPRMIRPGLWRSTCPCCWVPDSLTIEIVKGGKMVVSTGHPSKN